MTDRRFIAIHRGGTLDPQTHRFLANWAADCAERVLSLFDNCSSDPRPRVAIETARAWARGEVSVGEARKAAVAAHGAARAATDKSAIAAARAAGHAVATAHMADHCLGPFLYAIKAIEATGRSGDVEREWQLKRLPLRLRRLVNATLRQKVRVRARARVRGGREGKISRAKLAIGIGNSKAQPSSIAFSSKALAVRNDRSSRA